MKRLTRNIIVSGMLGAILLPILAPSAAHAAAVYNGRIIFTTNDSGGKIKSFRPDPGNLDLKQIADEDIATLYDGNFSPDGTKLAFLPNYAPGSLFYANPDGTNRAEIANPSWFLGFDWSPNGQKLVGAVHSGSDNLIYTMNADGSGASQLTNNTYNVIRVSYSPDGSKIAFFNFTNKDIYIMNADGSGITNLTNGTAGVDINKPVFSPDGTKIMYMKDDGSSNAIIGTMNVNGSGKITIPSALTTGNAVYSPDGTKIAYTDTSNNVHIMNVDGSNDAIYATGSVGSLDWQPLKLNPTVNNPNPTLALSNGKATLKVADTVTDPYGEGLSYGTIAITSAPSNGTIGIDTTTGTITYTPKTTASAGQDWVTNLFFARASAATSDTFSYRVCSNANTSLCATASATINLVGAPNTGSGQPQNPIVTLAAYGLIGVGVAGIGFGIRRAMQKL